MAYTNPTFEQQRAQVLKGTSGGVSTTPSVTTLKNTSISNFETQRAQILNAPKQVSTQGNPVLSTPVPTQATPNYLQQTQQVGQGILSGVKNLATQAVKKIEGMSFKLVTPSKVEPIQTKPIVSDLTAPPVAEGSAMLKTNTPEVGQPLQINKQQEIKQGSKPSVWQNVSDWFNNLTSNGYKEEQARAMNAYAMGGKENPELMIPLSEPGGSIMADSPMETLLKERGYDITTNADIARRAMIIALGVGLVEAPVQTIKGVATFAGADLIKTGFIKALTGGKGSRVSDLVPIENPTIKNLIDVVEFLTLAKVSHGISKKAPDVFSMITKDTITKYGLPEKVVFDSKDLRSLNNKSTNDLLKSLNITGPKLAEIRKSAVKGSNVQIEIQSDKITQIVDKPYWAKIKKILRLPETTIVVPNAPEVTNVTSIKGLLGTGEKTPQEVLDTVFKTGQENTPVGKEVIKIAMEAKQTGQNIQIDIPTTEVAPIAGKPIKNMTLFHGSKGNVSKVNKSWDRVLQVNTNQGELIQKLADDGNTEAQAVLSAIPPSGKVPFNQADPVIKDAYQGKYDVIQYNNNDPSIQAQGITYHDLSSNSHFAELKATAQMYALQSRGLKYGDAGEVKAGQYNGSTKVEGKLYDIFNKKYLDIQDELGIDKELIKNLPRGLTIKEASKHFDVSVAGVGQNAVREIVEELRATDIYNQSQTPKPLTDSLDNTPESTPNVPKSEPKTLTLSPSEVKPTDELALANEVDQAGLGPEVIKDNRSGYKRPMIGRAELKTMFLQKTDKFESNPTFIVDENKDLVYDGPKFNFKVSAKALQISVDKLVPGDKITVDLKKLMSEKSQQMRVKDSEGNVLGFNPKNLEDPFSPEATQELKKIVKQSEIAQTLSEKLGVPIRRGKFRHAGALGIYKPDAKVVRVKRGGLQTIFHEVAHYLDDTIGFSKGMNVSERTNLMQEYGYSYATQPKKQEKEAFAEYLRFLMTGQTEKIAQWAPKFDLEFQSKIKTMPDVEAVINGATQAYSRWNAQPATAKILSHLSIGEQRKEGIKARTVQKLHDLYTATLDDLHPLSEFSKLAKKNAKLRAKEDPYILARNLRGWVGKADLFLNKGTFRKEFWTVDDKGKTVMNFTGMSYSDIMKPVEEKNALDDFRVYIVAQRIVNDLAPRKIISGIALSDAEKALKELNEKYPEFETISQARRDYKDQLLLYAQDNGLLGPEGYKKIKELNKYHVPFYRVMEEAGAKFLGKTKIAGNIASPIKKIKGSEREIIDPLESDVKDTYAIINASERNNIGIAMANVAKTNFELGRLFEEVARPMSPVTVKVGEVMEKAMGEVMGGEGEAPEIPDDLADIAVTLFRPTYASGPNMLNVNMGDKQKVFEVDPDLFKAIQGLNIEDVGTVMKLLSFPAKVLRAGATLSPDFSVRNPLRDQFTAFVFSKNRFIPGLDLVRGMFELFKKGDVYDLWKAGGGEHAMFVSLDRVKLQSNLKEVMGNDASTVVNLVKNPLKLLQILSEIGEAGTRLGEMRNALAKGKDPIESAFESRNITLDFSRIGTTTRGINGIIAFFNASIQATDTTYRNFKKKPLQSLFKALLSITLPSILLYMANRDDPRWKEIPAWQKNIFWIVLTPEHVYRIPKPFELGIIFGSVPERILEVMDSKDPEMFKELRTSIIGGFTPGFIPTALIPIIENITNYSFFADRPIISQGKANLPPPQQHGPYSTEVSKLLGEALNYSPAKLDNLVSGYSGGLGKYAQQALDGILVGTGVVHVPPKPASTLAEMPVIKAFMIRDPIGTSSESVNRVYNMYAVTNQHLTYVKQLAKNGKVEEAKAYLQKHPESVNAIILSSTVDTFSDFNKAVDTIRSSQTMTPQDKADKIKQIQTLQTNIARSVLEQIKQGKQ